MPVLLQLSAFSILPIQWIQHKCQTISHLQINTFSHFNISHSRKNRLQSFWWPNINKQFHFWGNFWAFFVKTVQLTCLQKVISVAGSSEIIESPQMLLTENEAIPKVILFHSILGKHKHNKWERFNWLWKWRSDCNCCMAMVREHSYMTSDVFRAFLTYLPTLIRYFTT